MKPFLFLFITLTFAFTSPVIAKTGYGADSLTTLQREVVNLFQRNHVDMPEFDGKTVKVGFLINANNELIILDVNGASPAVCEHVKEILNYKKVKFNQAKQLTLYTITLHITK